MKRIQNSTQVLDYIPYAASWCRDESEILLVPSSNTPLKIGSKTDRRRTPEEIGFKFVRRQEGTDIKGNSPFTNRYLIPPSKIFMFR